MALYGIPSAIWDVVRVRRLQALMEVPSILLCASTVAFTNGACNTALSKVLHLISLPLLTLCECATQLVSDPGVARLHTVNVDVVGRYLKSVSVPSSNRESNNSRLPANKQGLECVLG